MQWFLVFEEKTEKWIEKLWGPLVKNDLNHKALGIELRMFWLKTQRLTKSALRTKRVAVPVYKKPWQIFYISNTPKAFSSLPLLLSISSGIITLLYSTDKQTLHIDGSSARVSSNIKQRIRQTWNMLTPQRVQRLQMILCLASFEKVFTSLLSLPKDSKCLVILVALVYSTTN